MFQNSRFTDSVTNPTRLCKDKYFGVFLIKSVTMLMVVTLLAKYITITISGHYPTFTLLAVSQPLADDSSAWACALETNTEVGPIFHVTPVASDSVIVCGSNSK